MKNAFIVSGLLVLGFGLMGCESSGSPSGVVKMVASAAKKNDLKKLQSVLSGAAQKEFGNASGLARIQKHIAGIKKVNTQATFIDSGVVSNNVEFATYLVNVQGDNTIVASANVYCKTTHFWSSGGNNCSTLPSGAPNCPNVPERKQTTSCSVTGLELK